MPKYKITAPVEGCSCTVAGVMLANSVGETDNENAVSYFWRHGYAVEPIEEPEDEESEAGPAKRTRRKTTE